MRSSRCEDKPTDSGWTRGSSAAETQIASNQAASATAARRRYVMLVSSMLVVMRAHYNAAPDQSYLQKLIRWCTGSDAAPPQPSPAPRGREKRQLLLARQIAQRQQHAPSADNLHLTFQLGIDRSD